MSAFSERVVKTSRKMRKEVREMKEAVRDRVGKAANNLKREVGESVIEVTEAVKVRTNRNFFCSVLF